MTPDIPARFMQYTGIQTQIRKNNFRTTLLLILFPCLIITLTWLFFFFISGDNGGGYDENGGYQSVSRMESATTMALPVIPWVIAACAVWFFIAYFANTAMIAGATNAHSLQRKTNMRVYNLVENLCISQGMKMPKLNIIEDDSLNAFASGINNKTFTVTLTRGIIDRLTDEELEGVIAHELSHIRNRDVRLLIISIVFVGIFAFLTQLLFRSMLINSGGSRKDNNNKGAILLIALALAAIGYLLSTLMRFAISRKREYMADAGAAEMTRNPLALASALRKISGNSKLDYVSRDDVAQLFIDHSAAAKGISGSLFATHPPIEKRIAILEQF